jgi:GT2 family glycosyltransferase
VQRGAEVELLVVDNGSRDGTVEYLREAGIPRVFLPENLGFARAVNIGIEATSSPLVMVLNEDTVLEPDCLAKMVTVLQADPGLGGVAPRILQMRRDHGPLDAGNPDATVYSLGQSLTRDGRAREDGSGSAQGSSPIWGREIFGVCGAACVLRRELLDELGGYDETYFAFYEDVDLNVRARISGWRFQLEPDAVVWHIGNAAWRAGFRRPGSENARLVARNRLSTQLKFMPARSIPRIVLVESGSLAKAAVRRRFLATLGGKLEALRRAPVLLRSRRRLQSSGDPAAAREWLGIGWAQGRPAPEPGPPVGPSPPEGASVGAVTAQNGARSAHEDREVAANRDVVDVVPLER